MERGRDEARQNPMFYVSSNRWNIHDVIAEFMALQRISTGPILLRGTGETNTKTDAPGIDER